MLTGAIGTGVGAAGPALDEDGEEDDATTAVEEDAKTVEVGVWGTGSGVPAALAAHLCAKRFENVEGRLGVAAAGANAALAGMGIEVAELGTVVGVADAGTENGADGAETVGLGICGALTPLRAACAVVPSPKGADVGSGAVSDISLEDLEDELAPVIGDGCPPPPDGEGGGAPPEGAEAPPGPSGGGGPAAFEAVDASG